METVSPLYSNISWFYHNDHIFILTSTIQENNFILNHATNFALKNNIPNWKTGVPKCTWNWTKGECRVNLSWRSCHRRGQDRSSLGGGRDGDERSSGDTHLRHSLGSDGAWGGGEQTRWSRRNTPWCQHLAPSSSV